MENKTTENKEDLEARLTAELKKFTREILNGHISRAATYFKFEKFEDALREITCAISIEDSLATVYSYRAKIFEKLGKKEEAKIDWKKSATLDGWFNPSFHKPVFEDLVLFNYWNNQKRTSCLLLEDIKNGKGLHLGEIKGRITTAAVPFEDKIVYAISCESQYAGHPDYFLKQLDPKTGETTTLSRVHTPLCSVFQLGERILYLEPSSGLGGINTVNFLYPKTGEHERLSINESLYFIAPFGEKIIHNSWRFPPRGGSGTLCISSLDPKTGKSEIVSDLDYFVRTAVPFGDKLVCSGVLIKDGKEGNLLTLLDPQTGKYEILSKENGEICTAVPYEDKILYGGILEKLKMEGILYSWIQKRKNILSWQEVQITIK